MNGNAELDRLTAEHTAALFAITGDPAPVLDDPKALASRQAMAALRGFVLERLADGSYLGARPQWGMHVVMPDEAAVDVWLKRIGALVA